MELLDVYYSDGKRIDKVINRDSKDETLSKN